MYDQFGCVELARTAWECPEHCGYHVDMDAVVMEFLSDGEAVASGERGEIVYTGLYNYSMPFIRYRVGDVGIPTGEKCPCGRGLPLMKAVEGRKDEFLKSPEGKVLSPSTVRLILEFIPGISQFKLIQEKIDEIRVQIVKGKDFSQETIIQITKELKKLLGEEVHIETEIVDEISRGKSIKLQSVISKVKINGW